MMAAHHVEYVIVDSNALRGPGAKTIDAWLKTHPGKIVFTQETPPEPDLPPLRSYLVKLEGPAAPPTGARTK
jgi:hypothetical protein